VPEKKVPKQKKKRRTESKEKLLAKAIAEKKFEEGKLTSQRCHDQIRAIEE